MRHRFFASLSLLAAFGAVVAAQQTQSNFGQGAYRPGSGVTDPALLREVRPNYTAEAMRNKIQGTVELEAVVLPNGTVGAVRVTKSLDATYGLDREAMAAARQWLFKPGVKDGVPVPVLVTLILEFRLRAGPAPKPPAAPLEEFDRALRAGAGVTDPVLVREVKPTYTQEARAAGIRGHVELEAVVNQDGRVTAARVVKSLDKNFGLDAQAVAAAREWVFKPGTLQGNPVPVIVTIILSFRPDDVGQSGGASAPEDEFTRGVARAGAPGAIAPTVVTRALPEYTEPAMQMKIQGVVELEAVVLPDGTVGRARVVRSLDSAYGLDDEALIAVKRYLFKPNSGTLNGTPVPFLVTITMEFKLR